MAVETPQQYMARIIGYQAGRDPGKILAGTPARLARLIRGKTRNQLAKRSGPGKWAVAEIVAHLSETEWVIGYRVRTILGNPGTPIQAYDQDEWARVGNYARRDVGQSLKLFGSLRAANLALWKSLTPAQWKLHGVHSERGVETIERIWRHDAGHDLNHLAQIEAILKPVAKGRSRGK